MPRIFMAVRRESRFPISEIMEQTPAIPDNCQWGVFLRNHDELTLEMVTDEERDYMWGEYAKDPRMKANIGIRRRLAPLLDNDIRSEEHTSELQSRQYLVCRLLLEKKKKTKHYKRRNITYILPSNEHSIQYSALLPPLNLYYTRYDQMLLIIQDCRSTVNTLS